MMNLQLLLLWQIFHILFIYQLNVVYSLTNFSSGTNVVNWTEDDWLETRYSIDNQFMFNHQHYQHIIIRTRMNQWSLELSYGNESILNRQFTEFHIYFDHRQYSTSLNNSYLDHSRILCNEPILSPITNDSNVQVLELIEMDKRIENFFINDGFFRTTNYIHCTINERRHYPSTYIYMHIYLVTNREFQSLLYIEMLNETRSLFLDHKAKIYIHNNNRNFQYNFDIKDLSYALNSKREIIHMIKLYTTPPRSSGNFVFRVSKIFSLYIFIFIRMFINH